MSSDTPCQTIANVIAEYKETDETQWRLVEFAWEECHEDSEWKGGSYKDALKHSSWDGAWTVLEQNQLKRLSDLGIKRYRDLEGNDCTVDVLEITKQIIENLGSHTKEKEQ